MAWQRKKLFLESSELLVGEILKRPTRADCKSADPVFAGSNPALPTTNILLKVYSFLFSESSSVGRAAAFQAAGREFEPRLSLTKWIVSNGFHLE